MAMVLYSIPDIRLFWSTDPRFLSQFKPGEITTFKPYSKYPACYKDVSFWTAQGTELHENDFCDLVRDVAGDLVEDVKRLVSGRPLCSSQDAKNEFMLPHQLPFNGQVLSNEKQTQYNTKSFHA
ncbi:phenylalanyl-tRNA synthetase alpha subunit, mitochondrial [Paramarasmius palmivorus]|uniref:Phenylalanyl-tRNA synthetase alpha subunit, mitochondrial n=1 Tax=Paramarasmius palmivorus TaxID=297713 RepID=A0AAW0DUS4_9AGAR